MVRCMAASEALGAPGDDSGDEPLSSSDAGMSSDEESELYRALRGVESEGDGQFSSEKEEQLGEQDLPADQLSGLSTAGLGSESESSGDHSEVGDQLIREESSESFGSDRQCRRE